MVTKILEIRDRMTYIAVTATLMQATKDVHRYYLRRAGYSFDSTAIILTRIDTGDSRNDPYEWTGSRTMQTAHQYIEEHFHELNDGDVIDVEFILGESSIQKVSERLYAAI